MRVRVGSKYRFEPWGWDVFDPKADIESGAIVRVVNLPGAPKANTMGHAHVEDLDGNFLGLVSTASLVPLKRPPLKPVVHGL